MTALALTPPVQLQPIVLVREFRVGATVLPDPDPSMTPDQVKAFWADIHGYLVTHEVEGPTVKQDKYVYEFVKSAGTKG